MMRTSMPKSSSPQPERGTAAKLIPLFDRTGPSRRPDLKAARAPRAGSVKAGRRPPPEAARSGLDRREHAAPIASTRNRIIPLDQQQSIFGDSDYFDRAPVHGPRAVRWSGTQ